MNFNGAFRMVYASSEKSRGRYEGWQHYSQVFDERMPRVTYETPATATSVRAIFFLFFQSFWHWHQRREMSSVERVEEKPLRSRVKRRLSDLLLMLHIPWLDTLVFVVVLFCLLINPLCCMFLWSTVYFLAQPR